MVNETNDVVLTALVHVIGDKAQPVYRRKDALEERHRLMEATGRRHCAITQPNVHVARPRT
jgi:hypothetical protein